MHKFIIHIQDLVEFYARFILVYAAKQHIMRWDAAVSLWCFDSPYLQVLER